MKKRHGLCFSLCKNKKGGDVVAQQPNGLSPPAFSQERKDCGTVPLWDYSFTTRVSPPGLQKEGFAVKDE